MTTLSNRFFSLRCDCDNITLSQQNLRVDCDNQTAKTDNSNAVAIFCKKKNSKMLQDQTLKVRKTCDNTCDTYKKMSYISLSVLLYSCPNKCNN